jgi:hypothetical protein
MLSSKMKTFFCYTIFLLRATVNAGPHESAFGALRDLSTHQFDARGYATSPGDFGGEVSWIGMTSGDGVLEGYDADKIWYLKDAINLYLQRVPEESRTGVFWAGGATTVDDFNDVDEFLEINLNFKAQKADTVYHLSDFSDMGLDGLKKNNLWWRAINRMSKGTCLS